MTNATITFRNSGQHYEQKLSANNITDIMELVNELVGYMDDIQYYVVSIHISDDKFIQEELK